MKTCWTALSIGLLLTLGLSQCKPPSPKELAQTKSVPGMAIQAVTQTPVAGPAQTVLLHGQELLVSRFTQAPFELGRFGGTFYTATLGDGPKTFNPWAAFDATSSAMGAMMLSGLVDSDPYTGQVTPLLAKTIQVLPDGRTYRITLRRGLKWSDGKPLTSHDVLFTWNTILKQGLGNPSMQGIVSVAGQFPAVRALDDLTVEFVTAKPFAPFLRSLSEPIAPAHILEPVVKQGGDAAFSAAWGTQTAAKSPHTFVSSGLWVLERYEPGERAIFKRNPHFFMVDSQHRRLPYLEKNVVSFVKDQNNLELRFEQGLLDTYSVPPNLISRVRRLKRPAFKLYDLGPSPSPTFLMLNMSPRLDPATGKPLVSPQKLAWFSNRAFRQALDWAVSRDLMVLNLLKGVGAPLFTAEPLNSIYLNKALAGGHPRDLNKAKALLKQAGFGWNPQGHLLDGAGNRVTITLLTNAGNELREQTGVMLQQDLAELGIEVLFKPMEFNVLTGKLQTGHWEAMILGLSGGSPFEPHFSANVWLSDGGLHFMAQRPKNSPNSSQKNSQNNQPDDRYDWEKQLDKLFNKGVGQLAPEKRRPFYNAYQQLVYTEQPMVYLYSSRSVEAVKTRLHNVAFTPLATWHNLESVWVDEVKGEENPK